MWIALLALVFGTTVNPAGTWRGTSLCQIKPSPCNDEQVVYRIKALVRPGAYELVMNKMVNGVEQPMSGTLDATFDARTSILTATSYDRQHRPSIWRFVLSGDHLSGKLTTTDGKVYRLIEVTRSGG
jgi:hypothetical protein